MSANARGRQNAAIENEFSCAVRGCTKSFKRKEHLVRHSRNHDETRPLVCKTCGQGFARSDTFNRHLRQHGSGSRADGAARSSSIACDICHDRKVKCPGGKPCRNCDLHGVECTRSREVKRRRPIRNPRQDRSPSDDVVSVERQISMSTRHSNDLIASTTSNRNVAMSFIPRAPSTNQSVLMESRNGNTATSVLQIRNEYEHFSPTAVTTDVTYTDNDRMTHWDQFRISGQKTSDPSSFDTSTINQLLENFFTIWHRRWPVLHRPSFDWQTAPWGLVWVVFLTAAKLKPYESHLSSTLQSEMGTVLEKDIDQTLEKAFGAGAAPEVDNPEFLPQMQTYVLFTLFVLYFGEDVNVTHADRLVVGVIHLLRKSGLLHHPSLHEQSAFGSTARIQQEGWRMVTVITFISDVHISILRKRPPALRYHELNFPLPGDKWLTVAGFQADMNRPTNDSWRTVSFVVNQCLEDTERGLPRTMFNEIEYHLAHCAIRLRLWEEKVLRSSSTMAELSTVHNGALASPISHEPGHRRLFWRQALGTWRFQAEKAYWAPTEPASAAHGRPPRSSVETLNFVINHLSVLEMWSDLAAITRLAESTPGKPLALSPQDRELIRLQLLIWASSFHGRLSIWHATQILCPFTDTDEFTITAGDNRTVEPIAKYAYYSATLVLWAFCLDRRSCPECVTGSNSTHQAAHGGRPALELTFLYEPDFYSRWIQKEGRFTFQGVLLCECRRRNVLNKLESAMMARGEPDAVARSRASFFAEVAGST